MDESDSDAEPQRGGRDGGSGEKYPVEGIYVSLAEKEEIARLPELQRETILAKRVEESERNRQNMLLRQLVNNQENEEKRQQLKNKKRSADTADLEDGQRKSSRPRTRLDGTKVGETSIGIDSLKRARAEKSDRQRRREEDRERQKDKVSPTSRRDRDALDDEDDWLNENAVKSRTPDREITARELPPAELKDFERIRVGRRQFAERCFDPGFAEALTGCYVRVAGDRDSSGENKYHMAIIKGTCLHPLYHHSINVLTNASLHKGATVRDGWPRRIVRHGPVCCRGNRKVVARDSVHLLL
jgi:RNA polymerase-associated protein RTF1